MPYSIRLAKIQDAESMLRIYGPYIANTTTSLEKDIPSIPNFEGRILKVLKEAPWISCTFNNEVIGYAYASAYRSRYAYQWTREVSVYVDQDHFGKNIGKALYLTLFDLLKWQGFANCVAIVGGDNPGSHLFHEKLGFRLVGTFHNVGYKKDGFRSTKAYELFIQDKDFVPTELKSISDLIYDAHFESRLEKHLPIIQ